MKGKITQAYEKEHAIVYMAKLSKNRPSLDDFEGDIYTVFQVRKSIPFFVDDIIERVNNTWYMISCFRIPIDVDLVFQNRVSAHIEYNKKIQKN